MKRLLALSSLNLALACSTLAGCAGVSVRAHAAPDANLAGIHSYAFHPSVDQQAPLTPGEQQIRASLRRNLAEKGLVEAGNGRPDVLIAYHTIEQQKTAVTPGYGYGYGYGYRIGYRDGWGGYPDIVTYTEGTLIVDLIDARTNRVVWKGTAQSVVGHPNNPNPRKIDRAVSKLMSRYPARPRRMM